MVQTMFTNMSVFILIQWCPSTKKYFCWNEIEFMLSCLLDLLNTLPEQEKMTIKIKTNKSLSYNKKFRHMWTNFLRNTCFNHTLVFRREKQHKYWFFFLLLKALSELSDFLRATYPIYDLSRYSSVWSTLRKLPYHSKCIELGINQYTKKLSYALLVMHIYTSDIEGIAVIDCQGFRSKKIVIQLHLFISS